MKLTLLTSLLLCFITLTYAVADGHKPNGHSMANSAVVFMYHHFNASEYPDTNVSLEQFEAHLNHLATEGYRVRPLEHIIADLQQGKILADKTVAITMDDAYISIYTEAWPRLRQRGWPFTVFVSTEIIDQASTAYMSWEQMREMREHGASFANHSRHHDHMIRFRPDESQSEWTERTQADIEYAQQRLDDELGIAPKIFAYPYGEYNVALKRIVKKLGYTAFGQHSGAFTIKPYTDQQQLPRYPLASHYASIEEFKTKAASLSLPVISALPDNPLTQDMQPLLTVTLDQAIINANAIQVEQLQCYVSGQGHTPIRWLEKNLFTLRAKTPLAVGRNRYNCTAPSTVTNQFYWFSRLWIVADKKTDRQ